MEYVVEMLNITKEFPGVIANDDITLRIKKGEIHALLGENGAGKSTLMSVLFGMYQPEKGVIRINGKDVSIKDPKDATKYGIGMVHQHFKLVGNYTVTENIMLGNEITKRGLINLKDAKKRIIALSEQYGLKVNPNDLIENISVGMQQRVEILKMLYCNSNILIFDEPTSVLTPKEIEDFMEIMKLLVKEGKSIILITHKLHEIKLVSNRCSVLRKGKFIGTVNVENSTIQEMAEMMIGRSISFNIQKEKYRPGSIVLDVKGINTKPKIDTITKLKNISFNVKKGEIVCIAGIEGNGQTQLVEAITGLCHITSGDIFFNDSSIVKMSIRERSVAGISHIPENRQRNGLVLDFSLEKNLILQNYFTSSFQKYGILQKKKIRNNAIKLINDFDIRCVKGPVTQTRSMSGGNQQKIIIAREITRNNDLLIAVQPTRGLDVGAVEFIHEQLIEQRDLGKAILLISLELDEIMNLSDRIVVLYEGENVGEFDTLNTIEHELGLYMSGSKRGDKHGE